MSRKQDDYLASLLAKDAEPTTPDTTPEERAAPRSSSLLGRQNTLARIAAGDVRQVTQQSVDPARCRIWSGNARIYAGLSEEGCRDLIESIIAQGSQKVPAIVRRVEGDPDYDFEVIAGTRRHWSISWLRANSYPDFKFLVEVQNLDDEAAFRVADLENRARKDVSDLERARNYAWALDKHYGGVQARMAERLRVSKGWLSKMLKVAELPDEIVGAFASVTDIELRPAYELALVMEKPSDRVAVLAEAAKLTEEQAQSRRAEQSGIAASEVMKRLVRAPIERPKASVPVVETHKGRPVVTLMSSNRQGVTLKLHSGSGLETEETLAAVRRILEKLQKQSRGLQR
jgi:ParB family chromosome partitioning protein